MSTQLSNPSLYSFTHRTIAREQLEALLKLAENSGNLFPTPLHIGTNTRPFEWMARFSLLGAGRHEHSLLLGILAGLNAEDDTSVLFASTFLNKLVTEARRGLPDIIAYPDISGSSADAGSDLYGAGDLAKAIWANNLDPRIHALRRDYLEFRFNGLLRISSSARVFQPEITVSGASLEHFATFDIKGFFKWRQNPDTIQRTGPLSIPGIHQAGVYELHLQLPAVRETNWNSVYSELSEYISRLGAYHSLGAGI